MEPDHPGSTAEQLEPVRGDPVEGLIQEQVQQAVGSPCCWHAGRLKGKKRGYFMINHQLDGWLWCQYTEQLKQMSVWPPQMPVHGACA